VSSLAGPGAASGFLEQVEPTAPKALAISGDRLLFGYDRDSIYVLRPDRRGAQIMFHPALGGLKVTDLGEGRVLFWEENARKIYVIDVTAERKDE